MVEDSQDQDWITVSSFHSGSCLVMNFWTSLSFKCPSTRVWTPRRIGHLEKLLKSLGISKPPCIFPKDIYLFLREEGILILSGGLTVHNMQDRASFSLATASTVHKQFDHALLEAVVIKDVRAHKSSHSVH